jgi:hypothetical protein
VDAAVYAPAVPDWQPNWDDVVFDHAKAQAAVDECRLAAGALTTVVDGLDGAHASVGTDSAWQGVFRDDYDTEQPLVRADAVATRDALTTLAGDITQAMTDASAEQSRRVADRVRWQAEADQERADREQYRLPNGKPIPR